ncbi:hypothetical protein ACQPYA_06740 [Micromonospora sp. CA-263727]|uniref:hypothetical protein n=1 Tax=Micromonospora sp. CA-263727 TaxID=3239967 RepID=UPI003D920DB3
MALTALALPAGRFGGIAAGVAGGQADEFEELTDSRVPQLAPEALMDGHLAGESGAHGAGGVEGVQRVLRDELDTPLLVAGASTGGGCHLRAVEGDGAGAGVPSRKTPPSRNAAFREARSALPGSRNASPANTQALRSLGMDTNVLVTRMTRAV